MLIQAHLKCRQTNKHPVRCHAVSLAYTVSNNNNNNKKKKHHAENQTKP